jgi:hypothetical protein
MSPRVVLRLALDPLLQDLPDMDMGMMVKWFLSHWVAVAAVVLVRTSSSATTATNMEALDPNTRCSTLAVPAVLMATTTMAGIRLRLQRIQ